VKVVTIHGPNKLQFDEIGVPEPGPNDVVVKVGACGICGSDIGYASLGGFGTGPMPLGHELSGIIAATGENVAHLAGAHVVVNPIAGGNFIGNGGPEGGFAPYLLVRNAVADGVVYEIPSQMAFDLAALAEPLAVALHAVNRAHVKQAEKAVVFGAGPIGLGVIAGLRRRGVKNIVAVDRLAYKLDLAKKLGAHSTIDVSKENLNDALIALHGTQSWFGQTYVGTDIFFEAAGATSIIPEVVTLAKPQSRLMVVALYHKPIEVDFGMLMGKEITILTAMGYGDEFHEAIEMLRDTGSSIGEIISHRYAFKDFMQAFEMAARKDRSTKVMITFPQ